MYQNNHQFIPSHTLFMLTNHLPSISGTDDGIWRRIMLIPFDQTIVEDKRDPNLMTDLQAEGAGILAWMVRGARAYLEQNNLHEPPEFRRRLNEYRGASDPIGQFIAERCIFDVSAGPISAADLYAAYCLWCEDDGVASRSQKALGERLRKLGAGRVKFGPDRRSHWRGVVPRNSPSP